MDFHSPAGTNPIDQEQVVGQATVRIDGPLKTTGQARYAYERHDVVANQAYGYILGAAIPTGRITGIDLTDAREAPGVVAIVTHENVGKLGIGVFINTPPLGGPRIDHYHQAVAIVVAESFEQARAAAALIKIDYERDAGQFDLAAGKDTARLSDQQPASQVGDFEGAFASADVTLDQTYTTPDQSHAMMEPHATIATWEGDRVTLWTSQQVIAWATRDLATILGIPEENIRASSPYIGGGFGVKVTVMSDAVMAALAAREAGRPVRVALQRPLIANNTTHRGATIQRVRLGATQDGKLTAIGHEGWAGNLTWDGFCESVTIPTPSLYAGANRMTAMRLARLDLPEASSMRAPGETTGLMGLEIAMDELAEKLGMDPVELRIANDMDAEPGEDGLPFSTRHFVECLRTGAERFGWSQRNATPGTVREDNWLIGMGMASAIRGAAGRDSAARVRLERNGTLTVETDMTDIGTGSYTIIAQTAAEMMGLPLGRVDVRLGDSDFPATYGSIGQRGATSSTAAVFAACTKLRERIAQRLGLDSADATFSNGEILSGDSRVPLTEAVSDGAIEAEDKLVFEQDFYTSMSMQSFGAHFVEVAVDIDTGETRVRRMVAACAAGRILNPITARSQVIGAMTMGVGAALTEELAVDKRHGFFVNHDLASYEVPVHADIPHQEVIFVDDVDPAVSPTKAKGIGELGLTGVAPAIANAIYNATGIRVRDYPITLDKLIDRLPRNPG